MSSEAACESVLNEMKNVIDTVNNAIKLPFKALRALRGFLNKMLRIPDLQIPRLPDFSLGLTDAFKKMLDCPIFADSADGGLISDALDKLEAGEDLPDDLKDEITRSMQRKLSTGLDELRKKSPVNQIGKLSKAYSDFLKDSGIKDAMRMADELYACVDNLCEGYSDLKDAAGGYMDRMNTVREEGFIDSAGDVKDMVLDNEKITPAIKNEYTAKVKTIADAEDAITNFSLPW